MVIAVIDTGDTAWVLAATALVLFMTPGLRSSTAAWSAPRTCSAMLMQNFFTMGLVAVLWAVVVLLARLRQLRRRRVARQLRLRVHAATSQTSPSEFG